MMLSVVPTTLALNMHKQRWINKLRYEQVKMIKMVERGKRILDITSFESK